MRILPNGTRIAREIIQLNVRSLTTVGKRSKRLEKWDRGGRTDRVPGKQRATDGLSALYASMKRLIDGNPGRVCLIHVGKFYELYFDQAERLGPKLGLNIGYKRTGNHVIPMAGFPLPQLRKYVEMLVREHGETVAIVDQYNNMAKTSQNLIPRKVSRIVSPGTLVDESFLNYNSNNYLVAISFPSNMTKSPANSDLAVGLAWVDVSVGETFVQQTTLGNLTSDLSRINPSEILIPKEYSEPEIFLAKWYPPLQNLRRYCKRFHSTQYSDLKLQFKASLQAVRKAFEDLSTPEQAALNLALSYISVNLPEADSLLDLPTRYYSESTLQMDPRTRAALELTDRFTPGRQSVVGTLLSSIRRTCTTSGARLLTQWLKSPLLDISEIKTRQNYVKIFLKDQHLRIGVQERLRKLSDFVRVAQKLSAGRGDDVSNLKLIAAALNDLQQLKEFLNKMCRSDDALYKSIVDFLDNFQIPVDVANSITNAIIEDENITNEGEDFASEDETTISSDEPYTNEFSEEYTIEKNSAVERMLAFSIRKDYNSTLTALHNELEQLERKEGEYVSTLQSTLVQYNSKVVVEKKEKVGKFVNVLHISAKKSSIKKIADDLRSDVISESNSSFLYRPADWNSIQLEIGDTRASIKLIEGEVIQSLRMDTLDELPAIRSLSKAVDFLDVTASFAVIADENNWVCPKVVKLPKLEISKGRHAVVESSLKESGGMFIPNDSKLGQDAKLWVISGPNMGGKSTYLRQNALMIILAQIGSYVPAESATIGIVDKIFTRIGASDDLFNDLSTFMVEMIETSNILLNATSKSFAIVDEVGRGTSGTEGLAIAYAVLVHLLTVNKCRTLFATHFGNELREILEKREVDQNRIKFYRTKIVKSKENRLILIDHALEPGISERSYALEVARKAGFPLSTLEEGEEVLALL
ncbi:Msh1 protein [Candida orthopsilosis Co 90-125]|uniref:Msh1 protein n=1 Tax=Candida orthopsilosis (strain 90-125) TaxID=1136231 RepID=H8X4Y2_CANO9|nr:Msh1 protein [Candida orthopsilosis Co 90-125]CCG23075.1 Msh1 protein [Candida orthopsilosis Co 90-125]